MSGAASVEDAVQAVKLGATEYFAKPLDLPRMRALMASMRQQFTDRNAVLDSDAALAERLEVCGMIGRSPAMRELFSVINRLAPHARTVLITGETGTGKELVARALHELGPRKHKKLVTVNCSAVVETLFESFGPVELVVELEIVGRVGEDEIDRGFREELELLDAVADDDPVERELGSPLVPHAHDTTRVTQYCTRSLQGETGPCWRTTVKAGLIAEDWLGSGAMPKPAGTPRFEGSSDAAGLSSPGDAACGARAGSAEADRQPGLR